MSEESYEKASSPTWLRIHDTAFVNWLSGLRVNYGAVKVDGLTETLAVRDNQPILVVRSPPEQVVAATKELLKINGWYTGSAGSLEAALKNMASIPLPVVSYTRDSFEVAKEGQNALGRLVNGAGSVPHPIVYWINYSATFWAKKQFTVDHIQTWVENQFSQPGCFADERMIPVVHPSPYGTQMQAFRKDSGPQGEDNFEGDNQQAKRFSYQFKLRAYRTRSDVS